MKREVRRNHPVQTLEIIHHPAGKRLANFILYYRFADGLICPKCPEANQTLHLRITR